MNTDPAVREPLIRTLLDAIDQMSVTMPDGSQVDYDAWEDVWQARQALRCGACFRDDGTHAPLICR